MGKLILLFVMFCGFLWGYEAPKNPAVEAIVNGASFQSGLIARGSAIALFGTGLDLVQVSFCGITAEVAFRGKTQINVYVPEDVPIGQCPADFDFLLISGQPRVTVAPLMVEIVEQNLFLFLYHDGKKILPIITTASGSLTGSVRPGQEVDLWVTGGGQANDDDTLKIRPVVLVGGIGAEVVRAEKTGPGVDKITIRVPNGIPTGQTELWFGYGRPDPTRVYTLPVNGVTGDTTTPTTPPPPSPREEKEKRPGPRLYPCWKGCEEKE